MMMIEDVLAMARHIEPAELRLLVQVEAASALYVVDRPVALTTLRKAVADLRALLEAEPSRDAKNEAQEQRRRRLKF